MSHFTAIGHKVIENNLSEECLELLCNQCHYIQCVGKCHLVSKRQLLFTSMVRVELEILTVAYGFTVEDFPVEPRSLQSSAGFGPRHISLAFLRQCRSGKRLEFQGETPLGLAELRIDEEQANSSHQNPVKIGAFEPCQ